MIQHEHNTHTKMTVCLEEMTQPHQPTKKPRNRPHKRPRVRVRVRMRVAWRAVVPTRNMRALGSIKMLTPAQAPRATWHSGTSTSGAGGGGQRAAWAGVAHTKARARDAAAPRGQSAQVPQSASGSREARRKRARRARPHVQHAAGLLLL